MIQRSASVRIPLAVTGLVLIGLTLALTHFDARATVTLTNPPAPTASILEWKLPVAIEGSVEFNSVYSEPISVGYIFTEVDDAARPTKDGTSWSTFRDYDRATRRFSIPVSLPTTRKPGSLVTLEIQISNPAHHFWFIRPNPARPDGKFLIRIK